MSLTYKNSLEKFHTQTGVNITSFIDTEFTNNHKLAIDKLIEMNFSSIIINPIYLQENNQSEKIEKTSKFSQDLMKKTIQYAKSQGLIVKLKPMINSKIKESRTKLYPKNEKKWIKNYNEIIQNMTQIAMIYDVEEITIASELDSIYKTKPELFELTIKQIKKQGYKGKISIATVISGENSIERIKKLNSLDIDKIGIDFYVSMKNEKLEQENKYFEYLYYLNKILDATNKEINISEIGYRSVKNGNKRPWFNYNLQGPIDEKIQKESYKNFLKAIQKTNPNKITGIDIWVTDTEDYSKDILKKENKTGYSPFNKQAENVLKQYNQQKRIWTKTKPQRF